MLGEFERRVVKKVSRRDCVWQVNEMTTLKATLRGQLRWSFAGELEDANE
jgi:hypothetical protein